MTHPPRFDLGLSQPSVQKEAAPSPSLNKIGFHPPRGDTQLMLKPATDLISQQSTPDSLSPQHQKRKFLFSENNLSEPSPWIKGEEQKNWTRL